MTLPPRMRKAEKHSIGSAGRKSEKRLTRAIGGRARPASGAMQGAKGDIHAGQTLMEAKSTTSASLGLKHDWLGKIAHEARSEGKSPALTISFVNEDGSPKRDGDWVCIPLSRWKLLGGEDELD